MNDAVVIVLSRKEAKELSTLLSNIGGRLQYKGLRTKKYDRAWYFWRGIGSKVSTAFGYEGWSVPSRMIDAVNEAYKTEES